MKQPRRAKSTSTKGHYVTNAVLLPEVIRAKQLGKVTNELAKMLLLIAERYSKKSNFVGYSFREDMVSAALMNLCNNALKFNPEKSSNPFAFYTTAIHHSFLQYMADEKKHRNIRDALLIDAGSNPSFNFLQGEKDDSGTIDSDDINFRAEREITLNDLPEAVIKPPTPAVPGEVLPKEPKKRGRKKGFIRTDKMPGAVVKYKAKDIILGDDGSITIKEKLPRKPRVKKIEVKKPIAKKPIAKKVATTPKTNTVKKTAVVSKVKLVSASKTKKVIEEKNKLPANKTIKNLK